MALPPGPRIGVLATLRYVRSPGPYVASLRRRFGDVFTIDGTNGVVVMTTSPTHAKTVFTSDPDLFDVFGARAIRGMLGARSLLGEAGEPHKKDRKLLTPPFHGQRMRAYGEIMRDAARTRIAHLRRGDRVRAHDITSRIAMDVILRAVFGVTSEHESAAATAVLEGLLGAASPELFFAGGLHTPLYPPFRRYRRAFADYERFLRERIARRGAESGDDILGLLLSARYDDGSSMDAESVRDQMMTLLLAGHETTAIALAWALRELALDRSLFDRARAEVRALGPSPDPAALAKLPLVGAIADETMRRHPIVTDVIRLLRAPLRLGEWDLPAGVAVSVAIVGIHHDPAIYRDPERFDATRFLEGRPSPFEFLPFGGGHRRCIGAAFSDYEMRIVLGTLVSELDFELEDRREEPPVRRNVTMGPARGVPLRITGRATA